MIVKRWEDRDHFVYKSTVILTFNNLIAVLYHCQCYTLNKRFINHFINIHCSWISQCVLNSDLYLEFIICSLIAILPRKTLIHNNIKSSQTPHKTQLHMCLVMKHVLKHFYLTPNYSSIFMQQICGWWGQAV